VLSPSSVTITNGATRQFGATVDDQFGNVIGGAIVTWGLTGIGSVSPLGLYQAPLSGAGTATVTATSGSAVGSVVILVRENVTTPIPSPAPSPTASPNVPIIVGETALFTRKRKHGKPIGPFVLEGFDLEFNTPLVAANAMEIANYQIGTTKIKKVNKKRETVFTPIAGVSVSYTAGAYSVSLIFAEKETFKTGGRITVDGDGTAGILSASGAYMPANAVFTISPGGKTIVQA
jgi:hypothetical protein